MKRDSKTKYYNEYFEIHKEKTASIWKGIRFLVKLKSSSKKDISIIVDKGVIISDQKIFVTILTITLLLLGIA